MTKMDDRARNDSCGRYMKHGECILGIDVGTTKTAACIVEGGGETAASASAAHKADIDCPGGRAEQDAERLLESVFEVVVQLPAEVRRQVKAVGLTGQMHSVVLVDSGNEPVTGVITWQDGRCLEEDFLKALNKKTGRGLYSGFGCATLAWLAARGNLPSDAAAASSIGGLAAARLTDCGRPPIDYSLAQSFGLFDYETMSWDARAVKAAGIPAGLLVKPVACGVEAGRISEAMARKLGLSARIPVAAPLGDNQASLLATLKEPEKELAITIGTGAQASAVLPEGKRPEVLGVGAAYEYRPYPGGRFFIAASPLAGGSAWAWLADAVEKWLSSFGAKVPAREEIYRRLNELGLAGNETFDFSPHFVGERHNPDLRGCIKGLDLNNFGPGCAARSLAKGIAESLREMLPASCLEGRARIVGSGNCLRKNPLIREMVEEVFGLRVELSGSIEEAAVGAAVSARHLVTEQRG